MWPFTEPPDLPGWTGLRGLGDERVIPTSRACTRRARGHNGGPGQRYSSAKQEES